MGKLSREYLRTNAARQRANVAAEKIGVGIVSGRGPEGLELTAQAPARHVFMCRGVHELVNSAWEGETDEAIWVAMAEDLEAGLMACPDPDCEWCNGE